MEHKAPRVYALSKIAKRKWKESDKKYKWFMGNRIQGNVYFCLFYQGVWLLVAHWKHIFRQRKRKIVGNEK